MMTYKKEIGVLVLLSLMMACSTGTKVTGSWTRLEHQPESFKNIVILGIANSSENRRIFEDQVETRLENKGYPVIAALDLLPPKAAIGTITKEIVRDIFISADIDAVFTMSVRHMEDTRRYVPGGGGYYMPYYHNMSFYNYYGGFNSYYYSPGYYTGSIQVYLEANFFDFKSGELIWSAQTKTVDVSSILKMAEQFADVIVEDFIKSDVVPVPQSK